MSITNVITRITVDMAGDVKRFAVKAKQYDRATRVIVVSLLWDEVPYVLDSADTVRCNVHKPDGTIAIVEGDNIAVSGNTVTITLPGTALTAAGRAWADIEIETQDESQQVSCQCFEIDIAKSPVDDDSIISTNEFSAMKLATKAANDAAAAATAEIEATAAAGTAASQAAAAAQAATDAANQAAAAATASIQIDTTLTDNTKAAPAGVVGEIKEDLSQTQLTASASGSIISIKTNKKSVMTNIDAVGAETSEIRLIVCGKNLVKNHYKETSVSGTTIVVNDDGSFTLNGTGRKRSFALCSSKAGTWLTLPEGDYVAVIETSGEMTNGDFQVLFNTVSDERLCLLSANTKKKQFKGSPATVSFFVGENVAFDNYTIKVMLTPASITDDTFEAYNGNTYTLTLPSDASKLTNIKFVDGINNIWSDAGNINIDYTISSQSVIDKLNNRIGALETLPSAVAENTSAISKIDNIFEQSYNLIDENKFLWDTWDSTAVYMYLEDDYYFPVTGGTKICTNFTKPVFSFYDNEKIKIGNNIGTVNPYDSVNVPENATWARFYINKSANTINIRGKVIVCEVPSGMTSDDYRPPWVPIQKIKGAYVEGDIYDTARPYGLNLDILDAAQYRAVRALNKARNALRIATFNIYVRRGPDSWSSLKQELKDYSIDICAMQEVTNTYQGGYTRFVQNYLTSDTWHFKFGSAPSIDDVITDKAVVSVYEIVSTERFDNSTQGRQYIKTVINLPRYKQSLHQFTLSIYSYHGDLIASNRLIEVSEILATIANDTSDFIVICGDTNAFASEADAQGKRPTWEAWISGGFTPIHYGEHRTVTFDDDPNSIDQIFMGKHVTCANYDIVNSNDYMIIDRAGDLVPISDHCMVYADLVFDFDAVLAELNEDT